MTNTVRTTIEPNREIEVSDEELLDLSRLGLVLPSESETSESTKKEAK